MSARLPPQTDAMDDEPDGGSNDMFIQVFNNGEQMLAYRFIPRLQKLAGW